VVQGLLVKYAQRQHPRLQWPLSMGVFSSWIFDPRMTDSGFRMEITDVWQYELAATLSLIGCITLPDDVVERPCYGEALQLEEAQMFRAHPEAASRLLSNVPRMEIVGERICG
jgi:response regulator RpfG family c-di-GMP phosphodiesterase